MIECVYRSARAVRFAHHRLELEERVLAPSMRKLIGDWLVVLSNAPILDALDGCQTLFKSAVLGLFQVAHGIDLAPPVY